VARGKVVDWLFEMKERLGFGRKRHTRIEVNEKQRTDTNTITSCVKLFAVGPHKGKVAIDEFDCAKNTLELNHWLDDFTVRVTLGVSELEVVIYLTVAHHHRVSVKHWLDSIEISRAVNSQTPKLHVTIS